MGNTLLHEAVSYGPNWAIQALLKAGADTTAKNNDGLIPKDLTSDEGIIELLNRSFD